MSTGSGEGLWEEEDTRDEEQPFRVPVEGETASRGVAVACAPWCSTGHRNRYRIWTCNEGISPLRVVGINGLRVYAR
jgi:hypothetical protein